MNPLVRPSLASEVAATLRDAIRAGEFGTQLPGLRPLSRELKVSLPVILDAVHLLREEGLLETGRGRRPRILKPAPGLATTGEKPRQLVFLTFTKNWITGSEYYQVVASELQELGFHIRSYECLGPSRKQQLAELEALVAYESAECWVLFGSPAEVQHFFSERRLPCMLDGVAVEGVVLPDFNVDFQALYRHAVHFLQGKGHRHIALVSAEHSRRVNPRSFEVFREAVLERIDPGERWEPVEVFDGSPEGLVQTLERIFLHRKPIPTGLLVATEKRVAGTLTWLMKNSFRVPEDVSLISRDYSESLEYLYPRMAHYRQLAATPKRFVRAILGCIDRRRRAQSTRIIPDFHPGRSVAEVPFAERHPAR